MKRRAKAKPRSRSHANDDAETLWKPLPGFPHTEFIDVAGYGRLMRKRVFPENGLHLVGREYNLWLSSSRSYADELPEAPA